MAEFRADVEDFVERHWPGPGNAITPADHAHWRRALVERGWSVPDWPTSAGGPGWNPAQKFLWFQSCASRGVDQALFEDAGVAIVGPMLIHNGTPTAAAAFLPDIRALKSRWCVGYAEPDVGTHVEGMSTTVTRSADGNLLNGSKIWVAEGGTADWMCTLARIKDAPDQFALVAVDLRQAGVAVTPTTTLDGALDMAQIDLVDVSLNPSAWLCGPGDGRAYAQLFTTSVYSTLGRSAVAGAQLAALDQALDGLDPQDALFTKRNEAAVALTALNALELRYVDALQRGLEPPVPLSMLRIKSREILLQLGTLQTECFGYYALPYPDEVLLHNEGPIGPSDAVASMRTALAQRVAALYEGGAEQLKDAMARQLEINDGAA